MSDGLEEGRHEQSLQLPSLQSPPERVWFSGAPCSLSDSWAGTSPGSTAGWVRAQRSSSGRGAAPRIVYAHLQETCSCHAPKNWVEQSK